MIGLLWEYFGFIGTMSVLLCLVSCGLLLVYFRKGERRSRAYLIAVGLALVGIFLGNINSENVSAIQVDRSDQIKAATQREMPEEPEGGYAYRQRGKQKRDASQIEADEKGKDIEAAKVAPVAARKMKAFKVIQANRWDRWNLFFNRLVFLAALFALIWDYLVRFNDAFKGTLPLPLAGRWLDALSPKRLSVCVDIEESEAVPELMRRAVRKGETFIYLGPEDPLEDEDLSRLGFWRFGNWRVEKWRFWKWRPEKWCWSLPRVTLSDLEDPPADDFALESTWFGRYALVVTDEKRAKRLMKATVAFLKRRRETGARARRSVNIIWDGDDSLSEEQLRDLVELCQETNVRLVVTAADEEMHEWAPLFEQSVPAAV